MGLVPLDVLVSLGLIGLGAGAGAAITWWALTRRKSPGGGQGP